MNNEQFIFLIEEIQLTWLFSETYKYIYRIILGLVVGLFLGIIAGMYYLFYYSLIKDKPYIILPKIANIQVTVLTVGLVSGLICGPIMGLLSKLPVKDLRSIISGIIFAMVICLLFTIVSKDILSTYVSPIFISGLFGGFICRFITEQVQPPDIIKPDWNEIKKYSIISLGFAIVYVLIRYITYPQFYHNNIYYIIYELLILTMVGSVAGGLRKKKKEVNEQQARPNQGIRRSIKHTLISFVSLAPSAALVSWVMDSIKNPIYLICLGLSVGLMGGLGANYGSGIVLIQHFTLRVILWCKGCIPWNYARFLDYATERIFLQKVGGGYIFIHRMLLEHFAKMKPVKVRY